jgi:predicted amidophosphoribosyltransferase
MFFFVRRDEPARCPHCGQRVAPYASGCSLCGASLDPTRRQPPAGGLLERAAARWRERLAARRR